MMNAVDLFDRRANEYELRFMDTSIYHSTFNALLDQCCTHNPNPKGLELACGPGNITRYLLDKNPNLDLICTDLSDNMLELTRKNCPSVKCMKLDVRNIHREFKDLFDFIVCGFVLPYLNQQESLELIRDSCRLLANGGLFYLSTMRGDYSGIKTTSHGDTVMVHFYSMEFIRNAVEQQGMHVLNEWIVDQDLVVLAMKRRN
jgi:ubiquinone/menaquinone biosynthesis C-methylase UbiE